MHDFNLYEQSVGEKVLDCIEIDGDSGYQGILKFHKNRVMPKKKSKGGVLSAVEKVAIGVLLV